MIYAMKIAYDGTRYFGWQRLPNQDTVQGRLETVLSKALNASVEVSGSGRTDRGVHARAQWASFAVPFQVDVLVLKRQLNEHLPLDIRVVNLTQVGDGFHPRFSALSKRYIYRIETGEDLSPFEARYCYHLAEPLNEPAMISAAQQLLGAHDFAALSQAKSKKKSTMRTVSAIEFVWQDSLLEIHVTADGFLYNMMRRIATVMVEVGLGKMTPSQIAEAIETQDRSFLTYQLPPQGLFLDHVVYDMEGFLTV